MSSGIIVSVKTKSYLKDYIINKYGEEGSETVKATSANKLFPLIARHLTRKPAGWKPPVSNSENLLLELPYSDRLDITTLCYIDREHFVEINSFLYGMFYCHFTTDMNDMCLKKKWSYKYSIMHFMDSNGISYSKIEYDSLKRIYARYRKHFTAEENETFIEKSKKIMSGFQGKKRHIVPLLCP